MLQECHTRIDRGGVQETAPRNRISRTHIGHELFTASLSLSLSLSLSPLSPPPSFLGLSSPRLCNFDPGGVARASSSRSHSGWLHFCPPSLPPFSRGTNAHFAEITEVKAIHFGMLGYWGQHLSSCSGPLPFKCFCKSELQQMIEFNVAICLIALCLFALFDIASGGSRVQCDINIVEIGLRRAHPDV